MILLWMFLVMQLTWLPSQAIYHEISAVNFDPPVATTLRENSYFGYSFDYQRDIRSLMISAPREDNIGSIYACNIDTRNCSAIGKDVKREDARYTHGYWLGATVKAGKDFIVTCAPRYTECNAVGNCGEFSSCYKSSKADKLERISSISHADRIKYTRNKFEETFDSFGWSIDVTNDNSFIIGGPAMFTGRAMLYKRTSVKATNGREDGVNVKYNLGYSVAAGSFFKKNTTIYAIGSPFGEDGHGKVVFCDAYWRFLNSKLTHELVGTMFGAVLATARVSGLTSDLLVGAPAYAPAHSHDVGAVYFYQTHSSALIRNAEVIKPSKVIIGHREGSQFGSAIVSAGDLNGDGRDEIAIAAPYEDNGAGYGQGAVYLYCGSVFLNEKDSTSTGYLQRIQPRGNYHGFGLSLSALSDYDENGCNELAIGAPDSNTVVLYRCMSAVTLNVHTIFPDLQKRVNKTFFIFQSCIDVKYPVKLQKVTATIQVTVDIIHQSAALAAPETDGKYMLSLHEKKPQYCKDIRVNLPQYGNYDLKINYKIKTNLLNSPISRTEFDVTRVLLSDRSTLEETGSLWAAECKDKDGCVPNLTLQISTSNEYVVGSEHPLELMLSMKNTGEVAYDACVIVQIQGVSILNANSNTCSHATQSGQLNCAPRNALHTNSSWESGAIILDTAALTNKDKYITVTTRLHDHCIKSEEFKEYKENITLLADSRGIAINGETNIGSPINMTWVDITDTGKQFEHIYTITNNALTNWEDVPCEVRLPKLPYINYRKNPVTVYAESSQYNCDVVNNTESDVLLATCLLTNVDKMRKLSVVVSIDIPPNTLENIIGSHNVTVQTNITLSFDGHIKTERYLHSIVTKVELRDISIPWWIILAATILGILILIIIGLILRETGFLQRNHKEKLKSLRQSVRRQTMIRTMMQGQTEDGRLLMTPRLNDEEIAAAVNAGPSTKKRIVMRESLVNPAFDETDCH